ncbi:MAG TPA: type II toxin-antitoxin system HicB family antitoxin [Thermoanaerobaculia bacterium]|jgi:predicted RNase H-like HicB family nuclease
MRQKYTVILEPEDEGGYHVFCPALPGCHSEGETVEESLGNIREAIELYVESLVAHGDPIPVDAGIVIASTEVEWDEPAALGHS